MSSSILFITFLDWQRLYANSVVHIIILSNIAKFITNMHILKEPVISLTKPKTKSILLVPITCHIRIKPMKGAPIHIIIPVVIDCNPVADASLSIGTWFGTIIIQKIVLKPLAKPIRTAVKSKAT